MQKELELNSGHEAFKSFQATVVSEQNSRLRPYEAAPRKAQSYQRSLPYREGTRVEHNTSYLDRSQEAHQFKNMYSSQDARVPPAFHHLQTTEQSSAFDPSTSRNPYVNGSYKCGTPGHTSPECNHHAPLSRAESTYLRNIYQRPTSSREFDFPIPGQAQNTRKSARDQQRANQNPGITQSHSVIAETIKPTLKFSSRVVKYNGDSDSDEEENVECVDVDLPCDKLSVQLLANGFATRTKKRRVLEIEDEADKPPKIKAHSEERDYPATQDGLRKAMHSDENQDFSGSPKFTR